MFFIQGSNLLQPHSIETNSDTEIIGSFNFSFVDPPGLYDVTVKNTGTSVETTLEINGDISNFFDYVDPIVNFVSVA